MNSAKKNKMLAISRRFTAEIEAALAESPELPNRKTKAVIR